MVDTVANTCEQQIRATLDLINQERAIYGEAGNPHNSDAQRQLQAMYVEYSRRMEQPNKLLVEEGVWLLNPRNNFPPLVLIDSKFTDGGHTFPSWHDYFFQSLAMAAEHCSTGVAAIMQVWSNFCVHVTPNLKSICATGSCSAYRCNDPYMDIRDLVNYIMTQSDNQYALEIRRKIEDATHAMLLQRSIDMVLGDKPSSHALASMFLTYTRHHGRRKDAAKK